jgi:hypothetical protein
MSLRSTRTENLPHPTKHHIVDKSLRTGCHTYNTDTYMIIIDLAYPMSPFRYNSDHAYFGTSTELGFPESAASGGLYRYKT